MGVRIPELTPFVKTWARRVRVDRHLVACTASCQVRRRGSPRSSTWWLFSTPIDEPVRLVSMHARAETQTGLRVYATEKRTPEEAMRPRCGVWLQPIESARCSSVISHRMLEGLKFCSFRRDSVCHVRAVFARR